MKFIGLFMWIILRCLNRLLQSVLELVRELVWLSVRVVLIFDILVFRVIIGMFFCNVLQVVWVNFGMFFSFFRCRLMVVICGLLSSMFISLVMFSCVWLFIDVIQVIGSEWLFIDRLQVKLLFCVSIVMFCFIC